MIERRQFNWSRCFLGGCFLFFFFFFWWVGGGTSRAYSEVYGGGLFPDTSINGGMHLRVGEKPISTPQVKMLAQ